MRLGSPPSLVGLLPALGLLVGCAMSTDDAGAIGAEHGPALYGEAGDDAGTLVVDLRDGTSLAEARAHTGLDLRWASPLSEDEALAVVEVPDLDDAIDDLRGLELIEAAEPSIVYTATGLPSVLGYPDDPMLGAQWNFEKIDVPAGWRTGGGRGVTVAVIDTGVAQVADLAGTRMLEGATFVPGTKSASDDNGHGTHVAGTIAQTTNNGLGVAGIAPNATILPLKALSGSGMGQSEWIASAIDEAVDQGADVINMSLGGSRSRVIEVAVSKAVDEGVIVIAAAGNNGREGVSWPARHPEVIGVSATGPTDELAYYSSWGDGVVFSAPGGDKKYESGGILQDTIAPGTADEHAFKELQGTSMATPHVAGAAAVLLGAGATSPAQVQDLLARSAVDLGKPGPDTIFGIGRIDIGAAVRGLTLAHHGLLFFMGLFAAFGLTRLGNMPRRKRAILASGVVAGGMFFLPLLPLPPLPFADMLAKPLLLWPQALSRSFAEFPLWLSAVLPVGLTFVFGPTRTLGPVVAGICIGLATHMGWASATGTLSPWFMPGALGSGWLAVNALLSVLCAMAIIGVQKTREREEARDL